MTKETDEIAASKSKRSGGRRQGLLFRRKTGFGPIAAILITLLAYFGSQMVAGIAVGTYAGVLGYSPDQIAELIQDSTVWQFWFFLLYNSMTLLILVWFMKLRQIKLADIGLGRKPKWSDLGAGLITFGLYFLLLLGTFAVVGQLIPSINFDQRQELGFESAAGGYLALVFISLVVFPAVIEEIMVRGFLFSGLRSKLSAVMATIVASLLFAAAHLQIGNGEAPLWIAAIDTFLLSVVLIVLRSRTGALWAGMITHAVKNSIAFAALFVIK